VLQVDTSACGVVAHHDGVVDAAAMCKLTLTVHLELERTTILLQMFQLRLLLLLLLLLFLMLLFLLLLASPLERLLDGATCAAGHDAAVGVSAAARCIRRAR